MDVVCKKEQIGTLFVWVGALEGGFGGWGVLGDSTTKISPKTPSWARDKEFLGGSTEGGLGGGASLRGAHPMKWTCLQKNSELLGSTYCLRLRSGGASTSQPSSSKLCLWI